METVVREALEDVDEDLGFPIRMHGGGGWHVYCYSCEYVLADWERYRWHVKHCRAHALRSPVCRRRARAAKAELITRWEKQREVLRRDLGLDQ